LPTGTYTIVGAPFVTPNSIVGSDSTVALVTGSPATVGRSATATVSVAYAAGTSTAGLWVINARNQEGSNQLVKFGATQLTASGSPAPVAGFLGNIGVEVATVAFDRQGNLWSVGSFATVTEYAAAQLDSANATPVLAITLQNPTVVSSIAFDSSGNLWMVAPGPCQFYEYSAATLATQHGAVTLTPDISITPTCGGPGEEPWAIAFDTNWNMWVSDNVNAVVYEYPADSLKAGFSGLFTTRLFAATTQTQYLAFDATGNLWITTGVNDSTFAYSPAQLADTTSRPVPHISIGLAPAGGSLQGLAFDNSGNLWTADVATNNLYELSAAQLAASGAVTPAVVIGSNITSLAGPYGLAFAPHSSGLPLFAHLTPAPTSTRGRVRR
jgi:ligand-binding sensor domain-containing protein